MKNNALFFKKRDFDTTTSTKMLSSIGASDYDQYYDDMAKI